MNVFKKLYKDFFGIKEQTAPTAKTKVTIPGTDPKQLDQLKAFNQELTKTKDLLKMGEVDTDDDDRPLYPITLQSVDILHNPFEDIVPRTTAQERKQKALEEEQMRKAEEEAKKPKGKK